MKISQHFALRIDFLKPEICTELTKLFTNTKKIDNKTFNNLIALYTDENWLKNFDYIEKEPFASASIGQVYNATYKSQDVVVKIINKDSIGDFDKDLIKIKKFFNFILFIYPKLEKVFDPIGILNYIKEYTLEELNLLNEIKGNKILKDIYEKNKRDYDLNNLKFNTFYPELSNENVLVSKKINGHTFDELLSSNKLKYSTLLKFFKIHGFYLFGPGIFHGDIHPGNIILDDNENIYFIDTGAISNVGEKIKKGLFYFFKYLAYYDYDKCAYYLNKMAYKEISGDAYNKFYSKFIDLYSDFENSTVSQVSLTKKMMETIKLGVNHGMVFEKGMFSIIKSMMYLDGMVLRCNKNAVLMKDMREFISEFEKIY